MDVYVLQDGQRRGPYQLFRLKEMLDDGALAATDSVWHEGMNEWRPLNQVESLRSVLAPAPPDTAPAPDAETAVGAPKPASLTREQAVQILRVRRVLAWRRFFARQIDETLALVVFVGPAIIMGRAWLWDIPYGDGWLAFLPPLVWMLAETVMIKCWGLTPGRALLGLRVRSAGGSLPTWGRALQRTAFVWAGGWACGVPPTILPMLAAVQWAFCFWHFQRTGETLWDRSAGTRVEYRPFSRPMIVGLILTVTTWCAFVMWILLAVPIPPHAPAHVREHVERLRRGQAGAIGF